MYVCTTFTSPHLSLYLSMCQLIHTVLLYLCLLEQRISWIFWLVSPYSLWAWPVPSHMVALITTHHQLLHVHLVDDGSNQFRRGWGPSNHTSTNGCEIITGEVWLIQNIHKHRGCAVQDGASAQRKDTKLGLEVRGTPFSPAPHEFTVRAETVGNRSSRGVGDLVL